MFRFSLFFKFILLKILIIYINNKDENGWVFLLFKNLNKKNKKIILKYKVLLKDILLLNKYQIIMITL